MVDSLLGANLFQVEEYFKIAIKHSIITTIAVQIFCQDTKKCRQAEENFYLTTHNMSFSPILFLHQHSTIYL